MSTIVVTKIDAARRQLRTAIELWAIDGDPVSIHSLAYAAHQIIHDLNRVEKGPHLFLDMPGIKEEKRREFVTMVKRDANFFKHADSRGKKPDPPSIEFTPSTNELFIMIAITGLKQLKVQLSHHEQGFVLWYRVHHPDMLEAETEQAFKRTVSAEAWASFSQLPKSDFLELFAEIAHSSGR
jgi:hypothetical protein